MLHTTPFINQRFNQRQWHHKNSLIITFIYLISTCAITSLSSPISTTGRFLWLSDIHLDSFYGTPQAHSSRCKEPSAPTFGQIGCDVPPALLNSTLRSASSLNDDDAFDFIIVTGDVTRHGLNDFGNDDEEARNVLSQTLQYVSERLRYFFPSTVIIISLGNNDVYPDYSLDITNTSLLTLAADAFQSPSPPLLPSSSSAEESFRKGGYYSLPLSQNLMVISLNTIIYSSNHAPTDQSSLPDPLDQFAWLEQHLASARDSNQKILLVGHIAPSIGSYRHSQLWHGHYLERYYDLVKMYEGDVIVGQLFGHIHSDEFRVVGGGEDGASVLFTAGSVTPIYDTNPNYRVVTYDRVGGTLLDYDVYAMDVVGDDDDDVVVNDDSNNDGRWRHLYSFAQSYNLTNLSASSLSSIIDDIASGGPSLNIFLDMLYANISQPECDRECRIDWSCTLRSATYDYYQNCIGNGGVVATVIHDALEEDGRVVMAVLFGGCLCLVIVVMGCSMWIRSRRKKALYNVPESVEKSELDLNVMNADYEDFEIS